MYWKKGLLIGFVLSLVFSFIIVSITERMPLSNSWFWVFFLFFESFIGIPFSIIGLMFGLWIDRRKAKIYGTIKGKIPPLIKWPLITALLPLIVIGAIFIYLEVTNQNYWSGKIEGIPPHFLLIPIELATLLIGGLIGISITVYDKLKVKNKWLPFGILASPVVIVLVSKLANRFVPGLWLDDLTLLIIFLVASAFSLLVGIIILVVINFQNKLKNQSQEITQNNYQDTSVSPITNLPIQNYSKRNIIPYLVAVIIILSGVVGYLVFTQKPKSTKPITENSQVSVQDNSANLPDQKPSSNPAFMANNTFFDISQVKVGQKVGEFTVVDIKRVQEPSPGYKNYTLVEFEGSTTISGNFSYIRPYENPGLDYWLGFKIDEKSQPLIPKTDGWGVGGAIQINVINQKDMSSYFKEDSQGYVEMAVKNPKIYYHHYRPGQSVGGAQNTEVEVEKIIKIIEK